MPRRSRTQITKELALKIVHKLEAIESTEKGDEHDEYEVYNQQRLIATLGIRRGSRRNSGHDHIPSDLGVGPNFAKQLGQCPKSRNDYLRQIGETTDE
jgi:hypothetical protein